MKKQLIDRLLEVARETCRDVEAAVSSVEDAHLRGVIAGAIMQRILQEVGSNEGRAWGTAAPLSPGVADAPVRRSGTQARIMDLRGDNFLPSLAAWSKSWRSFGLEAISTTNPTCG